MKKKDGPRSPIDNKYDSTDPDGFLIAGLGASAGGVQAFREFFQHVSVDSGVAYVVILHLSPVHDSKLAEVLQAVTPIPVTQVTEKVKVEPNNVYVVPPNQHLTIEDSYIIVTPNVEVQDRRAPVDIFFRSLADVHGPRAVCVILSGTGADGSMGLKRVKEMGGAAFVQNPREAEFNEMPRNAIATELIDEVLPVAQLPDKILSYGRSLGLVQINVEAEKRPQDEQHALREVFSQLRLRTGHDFSNYKRPTLLRRIERRITVRNLNDLPSYTKYIQQNPDETIALLKDLLISVTNFFRDKKAFEALEKNVLPTIIKNKRDGEQVRIWIAGCATGEEAYSIAMLCAEQTENIIDAPKIQIFATDIDESAIAHAREGLYTINDAADVSPERLRRFFRKDGDGYRVVKEIREMVLFANHNFIKDPPFSNQDMISCRNVLIYLNQAAQERVMETFHFALKPGGYLFLGMAETADSASDLYIAFNREHHIFCSRQVTKRNYPLPQSVPMLPLAKHGPMPAPLEKEQRQHERITYGELHQRLLEKYAPPSIIVNEEYDILHLSEQAGRYLQMAGGEPSQNLLKLVKQELRLELRSALYQATQRKMDVEARGLQVNVGDKSETINLSVRPVLGNGDIGRGFILVLFERTEEEAGNRGVLLSSDEPVARHLEEELVRLKAQLRSSNEQHEFQAEELKAANEELQAMNEELRSATEELETSKEELQSINEELRTVNQELKIKVEETTLASNNLQNLINSVDLAVVFLDRSFRINFFSPAARDIFNLIPADNGRMLSDITTRLNYEQLVADAEVVLDKLQSIEREVTSQDGRVYLMRVLPYRTEEDRINGVVITFFDITDRKQTEENLRASEEHLRLLIESAKDYAIFTQDMERKVNSWNSGAELMMGYTEKEILGQSGDIFFVPEDRAEGAPEKEAERAGKNAFAKNERWHLRKDGSRFYGSGTVRPLHDNTGKLLGFVKIMRDLTEDKRSEDALKRSEERLRITMESATDYAIMTMDTKGHYNSWSKGAELIFGFSEEEAVGKHTSLIFTPEDREAGADEDELNTAISEGRAEDERWHLRKDGSRVYMSGVMRTFFIAGKLAGFVKVARDMTERILLEQQKDEFIGIASHELKTPVTSIKAYAELLQEVFEEVADTQSVEMISKLNMQVDRLIKLIHALLDTTRVSDGELPLHKQEFDLNALIVECMDDLQHLSKKHNIVLQLGDTKKLAADKDRIGQVITNLLSNAIKYSPDGGDIIVATMATESGVQLSVRDNGIGIPTDVKDKVFGRFFRVSSIPQVQTCPGMGLGLYIAEGIIHSHGGTISVESKQGEGSVFYFTLPYDSETEM
jgi:two-component system CheB/CheR fusion protein